MNSSTRFHRLPLRRRALLALATVVAGGVLATGCGAGSSGPVGIAPTNHTGSTMAEVVRTDHDLVAHLAPDAASATETLPAKTPLGSPTALLVTGQQPGWTQVLVPGRPVGATAWLADPGLDLRPVSTEIRVDLATRTLTVYEANQAILSTPAAIGAPATPTPTGRFSMTDKLDTQNPGGAYGRYAFGLSGRSAVLTEFDGGDGQIGIHGTNVPSSIGQAVSHGCVRVPNTVMEQLDAILPLGTPVVIG